MRSWRPVFSASLMLLRRGLQGKDVEVPETIVRTLETRLCRRGGRGGRISLIVMRNITGMTTVITPSLMVRHENSIIISERLMKL